MTPESVVVIGFAGVVVGLFGMEVVALYRLMAQPEVSEDA